MANGFPCPNPSCKHVFPAAAVAGASQLTCPGCGKVIRLRTAPRAVPTTPAVPLATPANEEPPAPFVPPAEFSPLALRRSVARRPSSWGQQLLRLVLLAAVVGGLLFAGWQLRGMLQSSGDDESSGQATRFPKLNCQYLVPGPPWQADNGIRQDFKGLLALHRELPEAWVVLLARDYKDRTPREREVREEAVRRLGEYFKDNLEWEPAADSQLGGLPAQRLLFQGETERGAMSGECFLTAHRGIGYWLLVWAPTEALADARGEFEGLRQRFSLLKDREDWTEKRPARTFRGHHVPCTLRDDEGLWDEWTPASDFDPAADLALVARERGPTSDGQDRPDRVTATLLVLVLNEPKLDLKAAVAAARAHLEKQQKTVYPETTIDPASEPAAPDQSTAVGKETGHLARLHVKNGETVERFVLLGVVPRPDRVIVLQGDCAWKQRNAWEPAFTQLLNTFELKADGHPAAAP